VIGSKQSKTAGATPQEKVVVMTFAPANNVLLACDDTVLNTTETQTALESKKEVEERMLHRMLKVHNILEMWQGRQNRLATQKQ
jgi:hypothetical protein